VVPNRREAIARAVAIAGGDDGVIVLGKGHETYQEVGSVRYPMSDVAEVRAAMAHPAGRRVVETMSVAELACAMKGDLVGADLVDSAWQDCNAGVVTDSRQVGPGHIFVALRGERFDGHDYLAAAMEAGASAVVVEEHHGDAAVPTIIVKDTVRALGELAQALLIRARRARSSLTVVAVTGSNGKTTTKELTAALMTDLAGVPAHAVHRNPGNFNNWIGVPLTLFELRWGHEVLVLEMGANAPREIAWLVEIGRPDIGILTSVTDAHLEGFGSREGVLAAKSEIFEGMDEGGVAVLPLALAAKVPHGATTLRVGADGSMADVTFSLGGGNIVLSVDREVLPGTMNTVAAPHAEVEVEFPLLGDHNRQNLALAYAAVVSARRVAPGVAAHQGGVLKIENLRLPSGRLRSVAGVGDFAGVLVLDDCYNANPGSMEAGLRVARDMADRSGGDAIAVLGDMLELGAEADRLHRDVGRWAAQMGISGIIGFGPLSSGTVAGGAGADWSVYRAGTTAEDVGAVLSALQTHARPGDVVLVKGSRGMRMERIVAGMCGEGEA
jgi:UDP-N-acetylmuramoyl-tripeptide--D-alanyl-D-alanine ligase